VAPPRAVGLCPPKRLELDARSPQADVPRPVQRRSHLRIGLAGSRGIGWAAISSASHFVSANAPKSREVQPATRAAGMTGTGDSCVRHIRSGLSG
jgi:hypothetical protein